MILDSIQAAELDLIIQIQKLAVPEWLMKACSNLGPTKYLLAGIGIVYLCWSTQLGSRLALAFFSSQVVSSCAKTAFHLPRPFWVDSRIHGFEPDMTSYGFPSGHAVVGATVWLLAAVFVRRLWFWGVALTIIFLICASRVWLGSHFISDVVGGAFMGAMFVPFFLWLESAGAERWARWPVIKKCSVVIALSLGVFALKMVTQSLVSNIPDPAAWAAHASKSGVLSSVSSCAGAILGLGLGLVMSARAPKFNPVGPIWQGALRLAVIGVGALLYWLRPRGLMKTLPEELASVIMFVAVAFATWAFFFALPQLFLRVGLAGKVEKFESAGASS